ncbi:MAG: hypothetical protein ACRDO7_12545 [Nocardioidaceae bacterium]
MTGATPTDVDSEARANLEGWQFAAFMYVLWYNVGTIVLGLAEPRTDTLLTPAVGVAAVVKLAEMSGRIPRVVMDWGRGLVLPLAVAAVVVAVTH